MTKQKSFKFRFSWLLHLLLFMIVQAIFIIFDGEKLWIIFNLNDMGEEAVSNFHWLFDWFQIYSSKNLNYVTVVWIAALVLHGIESIIGKFTRKYNTTM